MSRLPSGHQVIQIFQKPLITLSSMSPPLPLPSLTPRTGKDAIVNYGLWAGDKPFLTTPSP